MHQQDFEPVRTRSASPRSLQAAGLAGKAGDHFRKVLGWSLVLVLVMCVIVYLQSAAVLAWMVLE